MTDGKKQMAVGANKKNISGQSFSFPRNKFPTALDKLIVVILPKVRCLPDPCSRLLRSVIFIFWMVWRLVWLFLGIAKELMNDEWSLVGIPAWCKLKKKIPKLCNLRSWTRGSVYKQSGAWRMCILFSRSYTTPQSVARRNTYFRW